MPKESTVTVVAKFVKSSFQRPAWSAHARLYAVVFAGTALLAAVLPRIYVGGEDGIYIWDYRGYWDRYNEVSDLLGSGDLRGILRHLARIAKEDYNVSPVLPIQPFSFVFTDSRLGYITAIAVTYLVPAAFITAYLATLAVRGPNIRPMSAFCSSTFLPLLALALTFPPFWIPTLRGFPDVAGLIPLGLAATIAVATDFAGKLAVKRAIVFGLLLWACFLLRRWYAYAVVAMAATSFLYSVAASGPLRGARLQLGRVIAAYTIAGVTLVTCTVSLQGVLFLRVLTTDYSDIYDAFQKSGREHFLSLFHYFGPIQLAMALMGVAAGLANRATRLVTAYAVLNPILLYGLFTRTQAFGTHHYLPLAFWIFILAALGACALVDRAGERAGWAAIALSAAWIITFAGTFFPLPPSLGATVGWLLPRAKHYQLVFPNRAAYDRLLRDVGSLASSTNSLTALGHDDVMSDELLYALTRNGPQEWLVRAAHVDKRDKFRIEPLLARYVIVTDPVDGGMPGTLQHVTLAPAQRILSGRGIGAAYTRLPAMYELQPDVKAYIFEKTRSFSREEVDELLDYFFSLYPNWRSEYDLARMALGGEFMSGGPFSRMEIEIPGPLRIWPGRSQASELRLRHFRAQHVLEVALTRGQPWTGCPGEKNPTVIVKSGSSIVWTGDVPAEPGKIVRIDADGADVLTIAVEPSPKPGCRYVSVSATAAKND